MYKAWSSAMSRRALLWNGAIILGGGVAITCTVLTSKAEAGNSGKVSQTQAGYQSSPKGDARCDKCIQFLAPSACKLVDGAVSPTGYCKFFIPRPR